MHNDFVDHLKWQYSSLSTEDLVDIWDERNKAESNYIDETFEAVRQILAERGALFSESQARSQQEDDDARSEYESENSFSFSCVFCVGSLRVRLPIDLAGYACPTCKARYQPLRIHDEPYVLLLVPEPRRDARDEPHIAKTERVVPPEVKTALSVFGLTELASFDDARQAYRNTIKQYHPDKVTHLGPELRVVAERKTKELIAAFEKVKKFFSGSN